MSALFPSMVEVRGPEIAPLYLTDSDHRWLKILLDEYALFEGERRAAFDERLKAPLGARCPKPKLRFAVDVLYRLLRPEIACSVKSSRARALVFRAAVAGNSRERVLQEISQQLGIQAHELEEALFADLPSERRLPSAAGLLPEMFARQINAALLSGLVARAEHVRIEVWGDYLSIARHARRIGLICTVHADPKWPNHRALLEISGPFSLFHHTDLYGRALASLLPRLASCEAFELRARCVLPGFDQPKTLLIRSGDPAMHRIDDSSAMQGSSSKLEERFVKDFQRLTSDWDLLREPQVVEADGGLVFPNFALRHRQHPDQRWLLEIVGFWTPEYLDHKLRQLVTPGLERLIVCIDMARNCADGDLPSNVRMIGYQRRRIDAQRVLSLIQSELISCGSEVAKALK